MVVPCNTWEPHVRPPKFAFGASLIKRQTVGSGQVLCLVDTGRFNWVEAQAKALDAPMSTHTKCTTAIRVRRGFFTNATTESACGQITCSWVITRRTFEICTQRDGHGRSFGLIAQMVTRMMASTATSHGMAKEHVRHVDGSGGWMPNNGAGIGFSHS